MKKKHKKIDILKSHDKFIKNILSNKKNSIDFLKHYLPKDLTSIIDFKKITHIKESFIDEKLQTTYSDLLFKINIKEKETYLYILFEHKSNPYRYTGIQLLGYMTSIWQREIKHNKKIKKLPVIIPYVFYHGKQRWNLGTEFKDIIDCDDDTLNKYVLNYEYILQDLSKLSKIAIKDNIKLRLSIMTMKYIFEKDVFKILVKEAKKDIKELLGTRTGSEFFKKILIYIFSNRDIDIKEIKKIIKEEKILKGDDVIMTTAEKLINQGYQEGRQEGILQGEIHRSKEILKKLISIKFKKINSMQIKIIDKCNDLNKLEKASSYIITTDDINKIMDVLM